jgi:hypothetical protein
MIRPSKNLRTIDFTRKMCNKTSVPAQSAEKNSSQLSVPRCEADYCRRRLKKFKRNGRAAD